MILFSAATLKGWREAPPPLTPPHKGEGDKRELWNPSPLWGGAGVGAPRAELSGVRAQL
jgi:hypothetical protein